MLIQNNLNKIKNIIEEFFQKMSFDIQIESLSQKELVLSVCLKSDDPRILIGEKGETLFEIQHLLKIILKKKFFSQELFYIDLDINDYKKKKIDYLKELAKSLADEVCLTKEEKILPPMSSYERRIIHLELTERGDVLSESIGTEPERRIAIKPIS